ncbi:FCS-Like Zinc finger 10-like [Prosopis cineraria]|uniref:FCS-Like Zinc finger 10-like n=1 Tax=Prosopis cineraria TaxID=364024 RepID=UPI00240F6F2A|nr:FCS-Like Zinc finger 10-like [Prosopis cineraria]XP_054785056.1 FCS-Like Zinc finger 10-like [Prosopis cineraria]XP_054785057.1 FCS-Like Zinc finger 10-like [Prosopis cineraria]XP_054785058.1 FCS-Like Zinc finger 10-like [Prosopis cineraria]
MADSSSDSSFHCDILSLRHLSNSFFQFSSSKVGFCAKGSSDSESAWSPTSPLDFRFFSNLSNPFSAKSSKPSSQSGQKKQFECCKIGLGIINTLADETKLDSEIPETSQRKNVVFGSQVKTGIHKTSKNCYEPFPSYARSNSLPKNYVISEMKNSKFEPVNFNHVSRNRVFPQESEAFKNVMMSLPVPTKSSSSSRDFNQISNSRTDEFCLENSSSGTSLAPVTGPCPQVDCPSKAKPSSLPISIDFSNGYLGSLSAREIELSEDYTCIISHGPNPKRTHIFGDCILECYKTDSTQFSQKEEPAIRFYKVSTLSEESANPYPSDDVLSFCYSCKKKFEEGKDVCIYRGEKAFCSFDCRSEEILAEKKSENNSAESSPDSSYHDVFFMNLSMAK